MFGSILAALNPIKGITDTIVGLQKAKLEAANNSEKLHLDAEIAALQARRDAMIAASANDRWWSPRNLMGWSVALFVIKTVVWDTVLQLGVTPNPGELVIWVVVTVIGFYFVSRSADTIAATIGGAVARKPGAR